MGQILKAGQKSARLMRVAAMQLCGVWLQFPDVARTLYLKDILAFAMHGALACCVQTAGSGRRFRLRL